MPGSPPSDLDPITVRVVNRGLHVAEDLLYAIVALVLVALAFILLVDVGVTLVKDSADDVTATVEVALNSLLLVFILAELLGAVRATIKERKLVAEPFLIVGIIASIKEIIVVGGIAGQDLSVGDAMLNLGVVGAVILALSLASYLLRRKEREPSE